MAYTLVMPSVYCDITSIKLNGEDFLLVGALLVSCKKDIQQDLWQVRVNKKFYEELHFSDISINDNIRTKIIKDFIDVFIKSESRFRCLLIKNDKNTLRKYYFGENWKKLAVIIRTLLSYPYFNRDSIIFTTLSRPRIFIDNENFSCENEKKFKIYFKKTFKTPIILNKKDIHIKDIPEPIIDFIDSKLLDQLQLVDILLGCIRNSYQYNNSCKNKCKQEISDHLLDEINKISSENFIDFKKIDRRRIKKGLINVWEFQNNKK